MPDVTYTPTGSDALLLLNFRGQVAASTTFQTIVDAEDAEAAKSSVYLWAGLDASADDQNEWPDVGPDPRPRAIVRLGDDELAARLGTTVWNLRGQVLLSFEFNVPDEMRAAPNDAYLWMLDQTSLIRSEMIALVGYPYCDLQKLVRMGIGFAAPEEHNGDRFLAAHFLATVGGLV